MIATYDRQNIFIVQATEIKITLNFQLTARTNQDWWSWRPGIYTIKLSGFIDAAK